MALTHWSLENLRKKYKLSIVTLVSNIICNAFSWNLFFDVYHEYLVNIASGYGSLPDGTKPQPELMLIKMYVTIWRH